MADVGLRWERPHGQPDGIGICLSGGGLRAASFSLGVIQVLQEQRQLLFGPRCARYLSAVSGGSYVASAHAINAAHLAARGGHSVNLQDVAPPLALGSPEEEHILDHGMYLVTPMLRTALRFLFLGFLNFAALVVLFVWSGTMLGDIAALSEHMPWASGILHSMRMLSLWVLIPGLIAAVLLTVSGLYSGTPVLRYLLPVPGLIGIAVCAEPTFQGLDERSWLSSHGHWALLEVGAVAILIGTAGAGFLLQKYEKVGLVSAVANWSQVVAVRLAGGVLLLWSGLIWYRILRTAIAEGTSVLQQLTTGLEFFGSLLLGLMFSYVPDRASLHREYRNRIRSCFGVIRDGEHPVAAIEPHYLLSELGAGSMLSPQLLICATANVPNRDSRSRRRAYAPFVMTHDVCGVPGTHACFDTAKLELGRVPGGLIGPKEPLLTLFTAVATTGAAVSPSMGRRTLASARPLLAALNFRLGRWLPNPYNDRMRRRVIGNTKPRALRGIKYGDGGMGPGYDELTPEMLGLSGPMVYVSDGGHFDNLGLLALLRARCSEIWCVDSSPDPAGAAKELRRVFTVAWDELRITITINFDEFALDGDGNYPATFTHGRINYGDAANGVLHVVKLGLSARSPQRLRDYRVHDPRYPHHKTRHQWYRRPRIEAYRDLGRDTAKAALDALTQPPPEDCADEL